MTGGGLSKVRLERLHDVMERHIAAGEVPGLVLLLGRKGDVHVDVMGTTTFGGSEPLRRDAVFRVSSMTKPVVAAAAMALVEDCTLRLDDPVDPWLPELADRRVLRAVDAPLDDTVPATRPVTLRDLLTFTLGTGMLLLPSGSTPYVQALEELGLAPGPPSPGTTPDPDEWMRRLGSLPLLYQPGERWLYNTGAEVLGVLLARASGQSLGELLQERLLAPLGMRDTGFSVPEQSLDRFGPCYWTSWPTGALEVYDDARGGQWSRPPAFPSGGAGLVSTADDFLAFGRMMLAGGRHGPERVLSRPTVETMTSDQLTDAQKAASGPGFFDTHGWGFGVSVVTRRTEIYDTVGRFGWDGGLGTSWSCDPREDLVAVLMTPVAWTSPDPPPLFRDFWTAAYQAIDD